jgi:hypothetical protein
MNADLQAYVREALARGLSRERVRTHLEDAHWRREEIEAALVSWNDGVDGPPVPRRRVSLSAREAFVQLVLFATLYLFAFDSGAILFVLIERAFRDAASDWGGADLNSLRWASSGVLTALPIFMFTNRVIERSLARDPEKRTSGVRRWLTYLTLFVAALVLIGNFSTIVSHALAGELTTRFVLKCLVVFAIAGVVFGHYLGGLRREEADADAAPRRASWLGRAGVVAAAVTVVAGLFAAGTPGKARLRQLDTIRVDNLSRIASSIHAFWELHHELPADMEGFLRAGLLIENPGDPVTHLPYGYARIDSTTYHLYATFSTADSVRADGTAIAMRWRHSSGLSYFTFDARETGSEPLPGRRSMD